MNGKGFFAAVVRRRRRVLAGYAAAAVLCALLSLLVSVNYDINDYLPPDAPSTTAIHVMEDAFSGGIPNVRAMARDVTVPEALALKQQIARVDGVTSVTWLDDVAEITVPLEMQDPATVEAYYKDGAALFPDAPTQRGVKHLQELRRCVDQGYRACVLFVVQMKGVRYVAPNQATHPEFAQALRAAAAHGVRVEAVACLVPPDTLAPDQPVEVRL